MTTTIYSTLDSSGKYSIHAVPVSAGISVCGNLHRSREELGALENGFKVSYFELKVGTRMRQRLEGRRLNVSLENCQKPTVNMKEQYEKNSPRQQSGVRNI